MSENQEAQTNEAKLNGLFAFKVGMSAVYGEAGEAIPVTVLRVEKSYVSQIKTNEKDGYEAVQVAVGPRVGKKKAEKFSKAEKGHLRNTPAENGAHFLREMRQSGAGLTVGQLVSINSLQKGDVVSLTAKSKGHGFAGAVKRYNFAGGPASHGSKFHRQPGSSGNRTWPGRVMPGKRWPGHWGDETVTLRNVKIVDVIPEENVVLVKGSVPGARNGFVTLVKTND
ncbi:MAG: 50S ribosomal protein L3 [Bdellovibrionales bacterium]|nr:50S ribosomal protein L3 [Bdellovibrionales bacterium]